jgi:hypothetical protein
MWIARGSRCINPPPGRESLAFRLKRVQLRVGGNDAAPCSGEQQQRHDDVEERLLSERRVSQTLDLVLREFKSVIERRKAHGL